MSIYTVLALVGAAILGVAAVADARSLPNSYSSHLLISDGVTVDNQSSTPGMLLFQRGSEEVCEQLYGFLPCSYNIAGHMFLIIVYEYLLFHGESYVASGSEEIFKMLGPGVFGASAFQVLGALPESLILLASGLLNSTEVAQEYVVTGFGVLAGSSILLLTFLWGTCVILGSGDFCDGMESETSNSSKFSWNKILSSLKGSGVITDLETSYMARIMVFSIIPFLIIQIPEIFSIYSSQRVVILCALAVSVVLLLLHSFYQVFEPWIQNRRLEYLKHESLIHMILQHVQRRTLERLLTDDGAPNIQTIKRLFEEIDHDMDDAISPAELKELLPEIKFQHVQFNKNKALEEAVKEFDIDHNQKISKDEFITGFTRWLEEAKDVIDKKPPTTKSFKDLFRVFQPFIQKKKEERQLKKQLVGELLHHVQSMSVENLLTETGTPDLPAIRRLFEQIDRDGDSSISESELQDLMTGIKFGNVPFDVDEAVLKVIEVFDLSGDHTINEEEFVTGLTSWLNTTSRESSDHVQPKHSTSQDDFYERTWEKTDEVVDEEKSKGDADKPFWVWLKSVSLLLLGVAILSVLAEPLIESVQNFSNAASIPPFFISFILVPLATNARGITSAIKAARLKRPRTTSLTFSKIYGGVFMSNMLGFCVLLSLVYARGLTWEFSAEVLVVLIVCGAVGGVASFRSTFPVWASILAYFLYPLSLLLVYVLDDILNYS